MSNQVRPPSSPPQKLWKRDSLILMGVLLAIILLNKASRKAEADPSTAESSLSGDQTFLEISAGVSMKEKSETPPKVEGSPVEEASEPLVQPTTLNRIPSKEELENSVTASLFGLQATQEGICTSIRQLERGTLEASVLKTKLIKMGSEDRFFVVENPVGNYVVYHQNFSDAAYEQNPKLRSMRIAIPKNPEQLYQEGAALKAGPLFQFLGIETFQTVGGSETQIPVFKPLRKP